MRSDFLIGRWQSPHKGHRWLINQSLEEGRPVLIGIRPMETDENNPFTPEEVYNMLFHAFAKEIASGMVTLQILMVDIGAVITGRGVGYDVISLEEGCPEHIKRVSATEIRRQIRAGEDGWRGMVMDGVEPWLEAKFSC